MATETQISAASSAGFTRTKTITGFELVTTFGADTGRRDLRAADKAAAIIEARAIRAVLETAPGFSGCALRAFTRVEVSRVVYTRDSDGTIYEDTTRIG